MKGTRYVHHVQLNTGEKRRSQRQDLSAQVINLLRPVLLRALDGERVPIPGLQDYTITGSRRGRCMVITLFAAETDAVVATLGVAEHSRCGSPLWRFLHARHDGLATDEKDVPPEPWCATRLDQEDANKIPWLDELEQALAWAWLERK